MRIITLEDHFITPAIKKLTERSSVVSPWHSYRSQQFGYDIGAMLEDLGEQRIAWMDKAGIDLQVVSLANPGTHGFEGELAITIATEANERLYRAVRAYPGRLAGFAGLPTAVPDAAVRELERCVREFGFKGALFNSHINGVFLDDRKYWPVFECAEALAVPIYLHPTTPHAGLMNSYFAGYEELARPAWGFAIDASCHFLRLMLAGVFDAFPRLKIIMGHLGEGLPFGMHRLNDHLLPFLERRRLRKTPIEYLRENLVITTSGNFYVPALLCSLLALGSDNIMFSVDWPMESNQIAVDFLCGLPISEDDRHKIAHANAERILRV